MTSEEFFTQVIRPNIEEYLAKPQDFRLLVNCIHAIQDFAGFWAIETESNDKKVRDKISAECWCFRLCSDLSHALKRGHLSHGTFRLVRSPTSLSPEELVWNDEGSWDDGLSFSDIAVKASVNIGSTTISLRMDSVVRDAKRYLAGMIDGETVVSKSPEEIAALGSLD
ncbi:hypothetical protein [Roseivivax marinus]|uniref:hypothetical protein n=1 Tax=Roseivivax marinus TaxID=1379903 RepID=UPI00103BD3E0|nr:hypothetical protein [Roseivivax marinus]